MAKSHGAFACFTFFLQKPPNRLRMKALFTLVFSMVVAGASAQIVFEEYFSNGFPESVALYNLDELTPDDPDLATMADSAWTARFISSQGFGGGAGSFAAFSVSWYEGDQGPSDDWMVFPGIQLGADPYLQWSGMAITSSGDFRDRYQVFVSTAGQEIENFFLEAPVFDTGEQGEQTTETFRSLNLSAFANQTVYIAFRNFTQPYNAGQPTGPGNGGNELAIDNIIVSEGPVSVAELSINALDFKLWPQPAAEVLNFRCEAALNNVVWTLTDLAGKVVAAETAAQNWAAQQNISIPVSHLPIGLYVLQLQAGNHVLSTTVSVAR
jgi:hypothetical protein